MLTGATSNTVAPIEHADRDEVNRAHDGVQLGEPLLKRQDQQEAGEQLDAGLRDPQLLQQAGPIAVQPLRFRFVAVLVPLFGSGCSMSTRRFAAPPRWRDSAAFTRGVAQQRDARPERLRRLHQCQLRDRGPVGEQPTAAALHRRIDEQPVLVDQPRRDQRVRQADAAGQHDVLAGLRLQLGGLLDGVAGEHGRVLPLRIGHRRGHHVLGDPVEVVGHAGGVVGLFGPVAAEILERLTPDQQRVGL